MFLVAHFEHIRPWQMHNLGGKASTLLSLYHAGFSVPGGVLVSPLFLEQVLSEQGIVVPKTSLDDYSYEELKELSAQLQEKIQAMQFSKTQKFILSASLEKLSSSLAVRSSAAQEDGETDAWAGQLESFLFCKQDEVFEKIKSCWSSFFSLRSLQYRKKKGISLDFQMTVVVQNMVDADVAGVAFSRHPVADKKGTYIEANPGVGEAVVSGAVTPESYLVSETGVLDKSHTNTGHLTRMHARVLAKSVQDIKKFLGHAVDVEWARKGDALYILQARPITTEQQKQKINLSEYQRLFAVDNLPFLVNDILRYNYQHYDGLFCFDGTTWSSYLPLQVQEKTLQEGAQLFSSSKDFLAFKSSFAATQSYVDALQVKLLEKKSLTAEETQRFFDSLIVVHSYYIYLEFFYTDLLAKTQQQNKTLLDDVADLKNSSRIFMTRMFFGDESSLQQVLNLLGKQFATKPEVLAQYTVEELVALSTGKHPKKTELKKRKKFYLTQGAHTYYDWNLPKKVSSDEFLQGQSAHQGKITAPVYVLNYSYSYEEFLKKIEAMPEGAILVTETTSPELFIACEKASGIITDQGGLLSHAAIVARELDIPCIVGTENATKVLKTGEIISLDTFAGMVKRI